MKKKPDAGVGLLLSKRNKGTSGLTYPSDGRITINSTYAFATNALGRDLGFNPGIFGADNPLIGLEVSVPDY